MSATSTDYKSSPNNCSRMPSSPGAAGSGHFRATPGPPLRSTSTTGGHSWSHCCASKGAAAARDSAPASGYCVPSPGCFRRGPFRRCHRRTRTDHRYRRSPIRTLPDHPRRGLPAGALEKRGRERERTTTRVSFIFANDDKECFYCFFHKFHQFYGPTNAKNGILWNDAYAVECGCACVWPLNLQTSRNGTSECFVGDAKWRFYFMFLGDSNGWGWTAKQRSVWAIF